MKSTCNKLFLQLIKSTKLFQAELLFLAQILNKSFGGWGFGPDPTGGAFSAPPDPLSPFIIAVTIALNALLLSCTGMGQTDRETDMQTDGRIAELLRVVYRWR